LTLPKPSKYKVKTGRKTKREKARQDMRLKMLFDFNNCTTLRASYYAGCGYDYALKKFREFRRMYEEVSQWVIKTRLPKDPLSIALETEN